MCVCLSDAWFESPEMTVVPRYSHREQMHMSMAQGRSSPLLGNAMPKCPNLSLLPGRIRSLIGAGEMAQQLGAEAVPSVTVP